MSGPWESEGRLGERGLATAAGRPGRKLRLFMGVGRLKIFSLDCPVVDVVRGEFTVDIRLLSG